MDIRLPEHVEMIMKKLSDGGYESFIVGGCVRDALMGRTPDDWDITTSARPEEIKTIFSRTVDTGIKHGTVTVLLDKEGYEVTTYRSDGAYLDGRHPESVVFLPSLEEDLKRRDFTINAMAYNEQAGLIDLFNGMEDLKAGHIRCVGEAAERFNEDALRMMRALRFAAQLDFTIDPAAVRAISLQSAALSSVSAERIKDEFVKLLDSDHPEIWSMACTTGVCGVVLPEFLPLMRIFDRKAGNESLGMLALRTAAMLPHDKRLRLAAFFRNIGKAAGEEGIRHKEAEESSVSLPGEDIHGKRIATACLRRMKFDNDTINTVSRLVLYHSCEIECSEASVRRAVSRMGHTIFQMWLELRRADSTVSRSAAGHAFKDETAQLSKLYGMICARGDCVSLGELSISGSDLIEMGMRPGRQMGEVLDKLLEIVLIEPSINTKDALRRYAGILIKELLNGNDL